MGWLFLANIFSTLLALFRIRSLSSHEKDIEILILLKQLSILQRKFDNPIKPNRADKMILAVLAAKLKHISNQSTAQLRSIIRIFQPGMVLRWHQQLVRIKWTYKGKTKVVDHLSIKKLKISSFA